MLKIDRLTKRNHEGKIIWKDIHLSCSPGTITYLRGHSGCGKSLLLKSIVFLTSFEQGNIYWNNHQIQESDIISFRQKVHYIPQKIHFFEGDVHDQIKKILSFEIYKNMNITPSIIKELMEKLELSSTFLSKKSYELSGGETQLFLLLIAGLLKPQFLLIDEITSNLDPVKKIIVEQFLQKEFKDRGILWVGHDEDQKERVATYSYRLENAQLIKENL